MIGCDREFHAWQPASVCDTATGVLDDGLSKTTTAVADGAGYTMAIENPMPVAGTAAICHVITLAFIARRSITHVNT